MKKTTIKTIIIGLLLTAGIAKAQNGLENVLVETYYVADANDAANSIGVLPVGSVTYRVYVDMLPHYKFEALYGVAGHPLTITSSTTFFNNEDRGAVTPNLIGVNYWKNNSVALDSWFTVGGTANGHIGVFKTDDDGLTDIVMPNTMLQNTTGVGIALTAQDGMIAGPSENVTFVGINNTGNGDLGVFDGTSQVGGLFTTSNGSVASLNGSYGPDTTTNKLLIGQFTTDGFFCFSLNIQIGTPSGGVQNYVANSPSGAEISIPSLTYCSNTVSVPTIKNETPTSASVYPNPASDNLTVEINGNSVSNSYTIYDMLGNQIIHKSIGTVTGKYTEKVDLSSLSKGMYFIDILQDGVKTIKKISKQ